MEKGQTTISVLLDLDISESKNISWKPECVLSFSKANIRQPMLKLKTHSGFHDLFLKWYDVCHVLSRNCYPSGAPEFTHGFSEVRVFCVMFLPTYPYYLHHDYTERHLTKIGGTIPLFFSVCIVYCCFISSIFSPSYTDQSFYR
jgi:hypothetical protein